MKKGIIGLNVIMLLAATIGLMSCGEAGHRTISENEYKEYQELKAKYGTQTEMSLAAAPPPPPSAFNLPIDTTEAKCRIKMFYEDPADHLMIFDNDSNYVELQSFHVTASALNYFIGSGSGQYNLDGVRFYFGEQMVNKKPVHSLILVGTRLMGNYVNGQPMYNNYSTPTYYDLTQPCPSYCSGDPGLQGKDDPLIFNNVTCPSN